MALNHKIMHFKYCKLMDYKYYPYLFEFLR